MIDVNCANAALTAVFRPPTDLLPQQSRHSRRVHRPSTRSVRNIVSSQVSDRSSWADEICVAVRASQFEVPAIGRQPRVEQFRNRNAPVTQDQRAWRLLAAVACIAFDANANRLSVSHRIIAKDDAHDGIASLLPDINTPQHIAVRGARSLLITSQIAAAVERAQCICPVRRIVRTISSRDRTHPVRGKG
jgi:hypothetical protein